MSKIFLIRHTIQHYNDGDDPGLHPTGMGQARDVGHYLQGKSVDFVVSSQLRRAQETAQIISNANGGIDIVTDPRVREVEVGEGLSGMEMDAALKRTLRERDWRTNGGETAEEVAVRMHTAIQDYLSSRETIAIVSSKYSLMHFAVKYLEGAVPEEWKPGSTEKTTTGLAHGSITELRWDGEKYCVEGNIDRTEHLRDITRSFRDMGTISHNPEGRPPSSGERK